MLLKGERRPHGWSSVPQGSGVGQVSRARCTWFWFHYIFSLLVVNVSCGSPFSITITSIKKETTWHNVSTLSFAPSSWEVSYPSFLLSWSPSQQTVDGDRERERERDSPLRFAMTHKRHDAQKPRWRHRGQVARPSSGDDHKQSPLRLLRLLEAPRLVLSIDLLTHANCSSHIHLKHGVAIPGKLFSFLYWGVQTRPCNGSDVSGHRSERAAEYVPHRQHT